MQADAFLAPYLCTDATGVLVQAPEQCQRSHFWVLVAPEKHVLYRFNVESLVLVRNLSHQARGFSCEGLAHPCNFSEGRRDGRRRITG